MKKYKALSRAYLLSYFIIIFCGVLFGFLFTKVNVGLALALIILAVLDLAALIVSRVFFSKHYLVFLYVGVVALGIMNVSVLGSFIIELIYTIQGFPAPYAWMVASVSLVLTAVVDLFYILAIRKIHIKKLIEQGIIEEKEEEI